jgi:hypothetical protein
MASGLVSASRAVSQWGLALGLMLSGAHAALGQELLDRVVARVGATPILLSDVRAAIGLGLVEIEPGDDPEASAIEQLIDRELALAEVARFAPPEPPADAIAREAASLTARAGSGLDALARTTGLDERRIRDLARDNLRLAAYLNQRFGTTVQVSDDEVVQYFRNNEAEFTRDGVRLTFEEAEPLARERASAARRAGIIDQWMQDLRARGAVTRPRSTPAGSPVS